MKTSQAMIKSKSIDEVEVGSYYKSTRTKINFKVIAIHRKKNFCCIVDKKEKHYTIPFDDINNNLIKGKIAKQIIW